MWSPLEGGKSQVVHTAWALLALIAAGWHKEDARPIERGVCYLLAAQEDSGDWPQQHITGVFNRNCMISYSNYRFEPKKMTWSAIQSRCLS